MRKGDVTRQAIVSRAARIATEVGLEGLTIGRLAEDLHLSKSGLFAHFASKEALQLATMEFAAARFVDTVVRPALTAPRGAPRLRALFENWLEWPTRSDVGEGCFFVAAAADFDDRPGPVRQRLVALQKDWIDVLAQAARIAVAEGHLPADTDPVQLAYEVHGVMLMAHHCQHLLGESDAHDRARRAFAGLLERVRRSERTPETEAP